MTLLRRALVLFFLVGLSACNAVIAADLPESDANDVVVALERSGLGATKEADPDHEDRWRVSVASEDVAPAARVLQSEHLPRRPRAGVLESLGDGALVPSRTAERARLVHGLAGELERSLRGIPGVLSARVHLAIPVRAPLALDAERPHPRASVLVGYRGAAPPLTEAAVQRLVAGAVSDLRADDVSVVLTASPEPGRQQVPTLARFGPLQVARESLTPLRLLLAGALGLNVLLVLALLAVWWRLRTTREAVLALEATVAGAGPGDDAGGR